MKLYWGPHTCAIGIHILLEECGADYELEEVDVMGGANLRPPFIELNPKGKIPLLIRDDGSKLTEYATIAAWLASTYKDAGLLPFDDLEGQTRMYEAMDYLIGAIHGQAFPRIFFTQRFAPNAESDPSEKEKVQAEGRAMAEKGFAILGEALGDKPYIAGERFTIGDTALFFAERWCGMTNVKLPGNIQAHLERIKSRPVTQKVMQAWGET